jgi:hypothetical protein
MLPAIASSMSVSLGFGMLASSAAAGHDLAGLAIATLHDLQIEPGFLYRLAARCFSNGFDRRDQAVPTIELG